MKTLLLPVLLLVTSCKKENVLEIEYTCGSSTNMSKHIESVFDLIVFCSDRYGRAITEIGRTCPEVTIHTSFCGSK